MSGGVTSSALPPGWRHGTLADVIASISAGVSVNGEDRPLREGEVGVLKITAVLRGVFEPEHHKAVAPADRRRVGCPVRGGTVLISRSNTADLVGASAYVPEDIPGLFLPDLLWALSARDCVNPLWLSCVLGDPAFRPRLLSVATGTSASMKKIAQGSLLGLPITIPPRPEQDRIVEIVQTWDRGISLLQKLRAAHDDALRGAGVRFLQLGAGNDAGEWHDGTMAEVVAAITSGVSVNAEDRPRRDGELGVLKTTSVLTGIFDPTQHKAIVPSEVARVATPVTGDTVLVSRMNTVDLVGLSAYVPGSHPELFLPDRLWQIATRPGFSARWLAAVIGNPAFRPRLAAITAGTSGSMKNISQADFLALPIPIPPQEVRAHLADWFAARERKAEILREMEHKLRLQKATLMSWLLSGGPPKRDVAARRMEPAHA